MTGPRVALFATCFNDTMWPEAPRATVTVLERLGVQVDFPKAQTCCGQMFTNTGYAHESIPLVRKFIDVFGGYDAVVAPSASCTGSVRDQYADLAARAGDPGLQRDVAQLTPRVYELSEYLIDVLGKEDVGAYFPHQVTYHPTCHSLRMLRVGDKPIRLLKAVKGLSYVELPDWEQCCGFGGTFAMKNADVSISMASDKARNVRSTNAEVLVSADNSCLAQIGGVLGRERSGIRTMHLAQVLASTEGDDEA